MQVGETDRRPLRGLAASPGADPVVLRRLTVRKGFESRI